MPFTCDWCQDDGDSCVKCGAGPVPRWVAATIVGLTAAMVAVVWVLIMVAWFGDLNSIPLIGK